MKLTMALVLGILLDRLLGEAPRWHPLVGFGRCAAWLEHRYNSGALRRFKGIACWAVLVLPLTALALLVDMHTKGFWFDALVLYFALGARALREHGAAIAQPLAEGDLDEARRRVSFIVSRDTANMNKEEVARATLESLLENGNDAIFGALFWCAVAGAPGVIIFRLANTLDAMWGYRTPRFQQFGWAAAKIDDVLNYLPARLTAASYALLGKTRCALHCWRTQAQAWSSPNAGPVMAAGAGSLMLKLGGTASYDGEIEARPALGEGASPQSSDIQRARVLIDRSIFLWLLLIGVGEAIAYCI